MASRLFVAEKLGNKYVEKCNTPFEVSYQETGPGTPVFFVLSPGVDPLKDVETLGNKLGFTVDDKNFHNISLGQGQEIVAENALDVASKEGHWVILQVLEPLTLYTSWHNLRIHYIYRISIWWPSGCLSWTRNWNSTVWGATMIIVSTCQQSRRQTDQVTTYPRGSWSPQSRSPTSHRQG